MQHMLRWLRRTPPDGQPPLPAHPLRVTPGAVVIAHRHLHRLRPTATELGVRQYVRSDDITTYIVMYGDVQQCALVAMVRDPMNHQLQAVVIREWPRYEDALTDMQAMALRIARDRNDRNAS